MSSDDRYSQLFTQLQSQHESESGSGSGAAGDDESGDDEDTEEDEEDADTVDVQSSFFFLAANEDCGSSCLFAVVCFSAVAGCEPDVSFLWVAIAATNVCATVSKTLCRGVSVNVMAISVISISSDSSEDSVGTPAGRVILFKTPIIAPTIPPSLDFTPASPDYSPASTSDSESDPSEDPSSNHIPPLPATSPFLSSDDDTTDSDTPDTPPSPTYGTPFTEITSSTQRSPVIPRRRVMILAPG
ncbi:hypothetical protein Tco_0039177 [Tanacetum coccineum]